MNAKTDEEARNEQVIRSLYALAEGNAKDTSKFVSMFTDDGYFYDVSAGKGYFGSDIGVTVDVYAAAFPDMHRELESFYVDDNVVAVELSLNGTHNGDSATARGRIPRRAREYMRPAVTSSTSRMGRSPHSTAIWLSRSFWHNLE